MIREVISKMIQTLRSLNPSLVDSAKWNATCITKTVLQANSRTRCEAQLLRGVARNGNTGWQLMNKHRGKYNYMGTVCNLNTAGLIADITQIHTLGLHAQTNYTFTVLDIVAIFSVGTVPVQAKWAGASRIERYWTHKCGFKISGILLILMQYIFSVFLTKFYRIQLFLYFLKGNWFN